MKFSLALAAMAAAASAEVGLMVPFYEYPTGDAATADWNALVAAAQAHPQLTFYVIINNNNGAPYSSNPPDTIKDWASWLGALNALSNVKTIGYVYTSQSARDYATVKQGIDQYASWSTNLGWSSSTNYDIHIDGIFFDEIDTATSKLSYNEEITNYAKSTFQSKGGPVVLNPGTSVQSGSESLFNYADAILDIETCYTTVQGATDPGSSAYRCPTGSYTPFTPTSLNQLLPSNYASKSAVVVHDFYDSWSPYQAASLSTLTTDVSAIVGKGVHSFYISQYGYRGNFTSGPADISTVATLAARAQNLA